MRTRVSETRTGRVVVSAAVLSAILLVGIAARSAEAGQPGTTSSVAATQAYAAAVPASSVLTPEPGAELAAFRAATSESSIRCLCIVFTCPKDGFATEGCNPGGFCGESIAAASAVCEAHCGGSIAHRLCTRTEGD
jgi:hypothetical protein